MKSILQHSKRCLVCGTTIGLEEHHVFYGSHRQAADRHGLTVLLCALCHRGDGGVHHNTTLDLRLKRAAQERFEATYSHDEFMRVFGRNYLEE